MKFGIYIYMYIYIYATYICMFVCLRRSKNEHSFSLIKKDSRWGVIFEMQSKIQKFKVVSNIQPSN
jgi:hypothetical protein